MEEVLVGSGHFGVGFTLGFIIWRIAGRQYKNSLKVQLYAPFIPFILGLYAAIPYFFLNNQDNSTWWNIFLFYNFIHQDSFFITIYGRIHWVALICGILYCSILYHYIELVKYCRRYGWNKGTHHAR